MRYVATITCVGLALSVFAALQTTSGQKPSRWVRVAELPTECKAASGILLAGGTSVGVIANWWPIGASPKDVMASTRTSLYSVLSPPAERLRFVSDRGILVSASLVNPHTLLVVNKPWGDSEQRLPAAVWRSDDWGMNWRSLSVGVSNPIGVKFVDAGHGYVWSAREWGVTTDGGHTWIGGEMNDQASPDPDSAVVDRLGRLWLPVSERRDTRTSWSVRVLSHAQGGLASARCDLGVGTDLLRIGEGGAGIFVAIGEEGADHVSLLGVASENGSCSVKSLARFDGSVPIGVAASYATVVVGVRDHEKQPGKDFIFYRTSPDQKWRRVDPPDMIIDLQVREDRSVWMLGAYGGIWRLAL